MRILRWGCLAICALCTAALVLGCSAAKHAAQPAAKHAARPRATLHFHGTHPVGADCHQGTLTASPPLCPSGKWLGNGAGTRVFTYADHRGSFTASFEGELEHVQGTSGPWTITDGTDTYRGCAEAERRRSCPPPASTRRRSSSETPGPTSSN
jgi:hypothetical protein